MKEKPRIKLGTQVRLLDQSYATLEKVIHLEVEYDNEIYLHDFYIYDKLRFDVLLGLDFCRKTQISLHFDKDFDDKLPNSELISHKLQTDVRLKSDYNLPAKSLTNVECDLEFDIKIGYFVPDIRMKNEFMLDIQEAIIEADNTCKIFIYNPRPVTIFLMKNLKIGTIKCIKEEQIEENFLIVNNLKETTQSDKEFIIESENMMEKGKALKLLEANRDLFGDSAKHLGHAIGVEHEINLTTDKPIKLSPYKRSPQEKQIIRDQIKEMLENGVIEESQSPYSAPVVLVKKKNGKIRFCVDYRQLNQITIKDNHPLPLISDAINVMNDCKYFSVVDLLSGYWNILIRKEDRPKTAFITHDGLYQWIVMPFGLKNAPSCFQRFMQKVVENLLYRSVVVYLDDFLIFSKSFEEHLKHLKEFFCQIRKYNLRLGIEKCRFLCKEVKYLGYHLSEEGIKPDEEKIKAVQEFPTPKNVKNIQSFLGLTNYYRCFVERYAFHADPLTKLLRKDVKFEWTKECQDAFEKLKTRLISAPILGQFREDAPNEIFTDACMYGMSAIFGQIQAGKHVVISYSSKMFNKAQMNYSISEKECLALVYAVKKYRHYIHGSHFTVFTDHNPIQYIMKVKNPNGKLMRYSMILMEYDFTVKYKPGKIHQNADTLSRFPIDKPDDKDEEINLLVEKTVDIAEAQKQDDWCSNMRKAVENNTKNSHKYIIENDILYRRTYDSNHNRILLTCLPRKLRKQALLDLHDNELGGGHLGELKTFLKVRKRFFWPNCERTVRKYVKNCEKCQLNKEEKQLTKGLMKPMEINEIFECVGVDILGPITRTSKGNEYIIIMIDLFSKWLETKAVKNTQSETIAKWFCYEIIPRHGAIKRILTDNASYFTSEFTEMVFELTSSKHVTSTAYAPQTNGNAERACAVVKNMLKMYVNDTLTNWDQYLPIITFTYNTSIHKTTRFSPFFLLYNREAPLPLDIQWKIPKDFKFGNKYKQSFEDCRELVKFRISESQNNNKDLYDRRHRDVQFEVGDLVSLYTPYTQTGLSKKFLPQRIGPFKIIEKLSPLNYTIEDVKNPEIKETVHIRRLNKWNHEIIPEIDDSESNQSKEVSGNITKGQSYTMELEESIQHEKPYTKAIENDQNIKQYSLREY